MVLCLSFQYFCLDIVFWFSLSGRGPGQLPFNSAEKGSSIWTLLIYLLFQSYEHLKENNCICGGSKLVTRIKYLHL